MKRKIADIKLTADTRVDEAQARVKALRSEARLRVMKDIEVDNREQIMLARSSGITAHELTVDLGSIKAVVGVGTGGWSDGKEERWTVRFDLSTSLDGRRWTRPLRCPGNVD